MKQKFLLKTMLLLCALVAGSSSVWAEDYELYSGTITEGDYVIYYNGYALKNTVSNSRFDNQSVTPSEDKIANPAAAIVWHIAKDGDYWTIYNAAVNKYAGGNGSKNQGALLASVTNYAKWTVTGTTTYEFENKGRAEGSSNTGNKWLRNNGANGWACYADATGGALSLYKKVEAAGAATTVTINSTGITNTNKFLGTAAGSLTAAVTVTATSTAIDGASVTWSSSNESIATIGESTGVVTLVGEGTTTITASYAGEVGEYKSSYAEYVLTVTDDNPNAITLWSEDFSSYSEGDKPSGGTYNYVCVDGGTNTQIYNGNNSGGTAPELLVNKNGGSFTATIPLENIVGNLKLKFKSNAYAITISTSTENISISSNASFNTAGEHTVTFTGVTTSMTSVEIKFAAGTSNVRIDDIELKGSKIVPATITAAEYATFSSAYALDFSETGITAYTATDNKNSVTLNEITTGKVPANTPVVLYKAGADGTAINVPVIESAAAINSVNSLVVSDGTTPTNAYVLANKSQGVGFYKWTGGNITAGKIYLQASGSYGAPEFLGFGDATAIDDVRSKTEEVRGEYFNLAGQRVAQPTKGLYIVNGKKVIMK